MALLFQIIISVCSLSAVFTQVSRIDIEGLGTGVFQQPYVKQIKEIAELIRAKECEKVIQYLSTSTSYYSTDLRYRYLWLRGFCYLETGDLENAVKDLILGSGRDKTNEIIVDFITIEAYLSFGEYLEDAHKKMRNLRHPDLLKLGDRLCSKRKLYEALQCYSEAFVQFENSSIPPYDCYISRGNCYAKLKDFDLSLANFKQAKSFKPSSSRERETDDDGEVQVLLIHALFDAGFFDEALTRTSHLKSEEDVVSAIEGILAKNKNFDEVFQFFSQAIKKHPKNSVLYEKRGHFHWRMKKYTEAIEDFRKAKTLYPTLIDNWTSLIKLLLLTGEHAQTKKVFEEFDKLALPMKNSELAKLEDVRLEFLRVVQKEEMKKINNETIAKNL